MNNEWKNEHWEWEKSPKSSVCKMSLKTSDSILFLKSMRFSLFKGMGIVCGGGSAYVEQIIRRSDGEALSLDLEAVGGDMWAVIDRESDKLKASDQQKRQAVSK